MTVAELKAALAALPDGMPVVVTGFEETGFGNAHLKRVHLVMNRPASRYTGGEHSEWDAKVDAVEIMTEAVWLDHNP